MIKLSEGEAPVRDSVRMVCETLGYDPCWLACEGGVIAVAAAARTQTLLEARQPDEHECHASVAMVVRETKNCVGFETEPAINDSSSNSRKPPAEDLLEQCRISLQRTAARTAGKCILQYRSKIMAQTVGFIGLGVMGYPMAGHLAASGHQVRVYNRSPIRAEQWCGEHGGAALPSPASAASGCSVVFCCVGNDDDLRSVALGETGAFKGMDSGAVFVDHTTTSARVARELAAVAAESGIGFIDAPVSGGQAGAESGQLTVMIGGDPNAVTRVEPLIASYARMQARLGGAGAGQLAKMVNQICIAGTVQGLAEALQFAKRAGLDAGRVIDVISKGAAQSWQMENRASTMIEGRYDFGFAVDWMRKDLAYVLEEARLNGSHLPLTALVDQFYSEVQALGGGRWDTSSLLARLDNSSK